MGFIYIGSGVGEVWGLGRFGRCSFIGVDSGFFFVVVYDVVFVLWRDGVYGYFYGRRFGGEVFVWCGRGVVFYYCVFLFILRLFLV